MDILVHTKTQRLTMKVMQSDACRHIKAHTLQKSIKCILAY